MTHAMRTRQKLNLTEKDMEKLRQLSVSRSEPFSASGEGENSLRLPPGSEEESHCAGYRSE